MRVKEVDMLQAEKARELHCSRLQGVSDKLNLPL